MFFKVTTFAVFCFCATLMQALGKEIKNIVPPLMMTMEEQNLLDAYLDAYIVSSVKKTQLATVETNSNKDKENLFLSAIIYFSPEQWTIFINDEMITESNQFQNSFQTSYGVEITDVGPQHIAITKKMDEGLINHPSDNFVSDNFVSSDKNSREPLSTVLVRPNQTLVLPNMEIKQGDWRQKPATELK